MEIAYHRMLMENYSKLSLERYKQCISIRNFTNETIHRLLE